MEEIKEILARCRSFLNKSRAEIIIIMENPVLSEWSRINIREFNDILESLDIPSNFIHAQGQYLNEAKKSLLQIETLENEVGSVEADFNLKLAPPQKLLQDSRKAENNCRDLEKNMTTLACYVDILKNTDKTIRDLLNLEQFFPIARRLSDNPDGFDSGVRVFRALSMEKEMSAHNVYELFTAANRLEARLDQIELSTFPGIVASVLKNRIDVCLDATREIKNYLDHTASFVGKELNIMRAISARLKDYRHDPISLLLKSLKREAAATVKTLFDLRRHGYVLPELNYVTLLLQEVNAFCTGMKQDVTVKLREMMSDTNSPLAPYRTADTFVQRFFGGIRGLYRMILMLFLSITGQPILSEKALRQYIEKSIHDSPVCKAGSEADQERLTAFLEESIARVSRPFPYDEVLTLLKSAVNEYVLLVSKFVDNCEISIELEAPRDSPLGLNPDEENEVYAIKITIGSLIRKISIRTENLNKHQLVDTE